MMPTVQDFLDAYAKHKRTPVTSNFGAKIINGIIDAEQQCCPLTVLCIGKPVDEFAMKYGLHPSDMVCRIVEETYEGFNAADFWLTFDGARGMSHPVALELRKALGFGTATPPAPDTTL